MFTKSTLWFFLRKISNLRFSILVLLSIAFISMIGTIVEQDQSVEYYKLNYPQDKPVLLILTWKQIIGLGLDHIYTNYFFFILLTLFFLTLITCTLSTQLPVLNQARRWKFFYNDLPEKKVFYYCQLKPASIVNFTYLLNMNQYYVFHKNKAIYAYKGLMGRISPIFVHLSIILTLVGSMISLSCGFLAQEIIPLGEIFHVQNIVKSGFFSYFNEGLTGKVNDFYIDYNQDNSIKQFFSDISIIDSHGSIIDKKIIAVNHPLYFNGLVLYQTNWNLSAIRIGLGQNITIEKALTEISSKDRDSTYWICKLKISNQYDVSIVVDSISNHVLLYDFNGNLIKDTEYGLWNIVYGVPLVFKDLMPTTGLQVKVDPGVTLSYSSFFILMISIVISYISYAQVWANSILGQFYFSGKTNRAVLAFEDEMLKIAKKYKVLLHFGS